MPNQNKTPDDLKPASSTSNEDTAAVVKPRRPASRRKAAARPAAGNLVNVLFVDIVGSAKLPGAEQLRVMDELKKIAINTTAYRREKRKKSLISIDTGDGIALAFFHDYTAPAFCAREIAIALKAHPDIQIRMGANTGPAYRRKSFNGFNLSGDGINMAQRVMDCGDAGHFLVSKTVADFLRDLKDWDGHLQDLGPCTVKHGTLIHLYNVYSADFGNEAVPEKVRKSKSEPTPEVAPVDPDIGKVFYVDPIDSTVVEALPPQENPWVQTFGISYFSEHQGLQGLRYAPAALGKKPQDAIFVPIKLQTLQEDIEEVRLSVAELTRLAHARQPRAEYGVEKAAGALADHALPRRGFAGMLEPGLYPQLDLVQDAASEIPWEVLEERSFICPACQYQSDPSHGQETTQMFCSKCGERMNRAGGKLALTLHLSHLVRGNWKPGSEGRQFLFIEDPQGDLCQPHADPEGICAKHLVDLRNKLQQQGFKIVSLQNRNATVNRVLSSISDPETIGIYYFGHGYYPRGGDEGRLVLSDGEVSANQIAQHEPSARFVLLNTCDGPALRHDWSLDKKARSVATAFARGGRGKVVIAPLWPMMNVQAAEMAHDFFQKALDALPLIEALRAARLNSFKRYEEGEPHLTWMAYRYFGDPNRTLPIISEPPVTVENAVPSRVFANEGLLDTELFAFEIDSILFRATKRKFNQDREQVAPIDLFAGLLRKGDLTRYLLRQQSLDPDELYEGLGGTVERVKEEEEEEEE